MIKKRKAASLKNAQRISKGSQRGCDLCRIRLYCYVEITDIFLTDKYPRHKLCNDDFRIKFLNFSDNISSKTLPLNKQLISFVGQFFVVNK